MTKDPIARAVAAAHGVTLAAVTEGDPAHRTFGQSLLRHLRLVATDVTAMVAVALFLIAGGLLVEGARYRYLDFSPIGILGIINYMTIGFLMPKRMRPRRHRWVQRRRQ